MFETLRKATEALQGLQSSMDGIRRILVSRIDNAEQKDALTDRVAALEVGYAKWSAEAEATLLKADALFKNARNSEERARDKSKKRNGVDAGQLEGEAEIRAAYEELYGLPVDGEGAAPSPSRMLIESAVEQDRTESSRALRLRAKYR